MTTKPIDRHHDEVDTIATPMTNRQLSGQTRRLAFACTTLVLTLLMTACGGGRAVTEPAPQPVVQDTPKQQTLPVNPNFDARPLIVDDQVIVRNGVDGDYVAPTQSAATYEDAARYAQSPERESLLLTAADAWARAGNVEQAAQILVGLRNAQLDDIQELRLQLVRARIDQGKQRHQLANGRLINLMSRQPLPVGVAGETLRMLTMSKVALGDRLQAAGYLIQRQSIMTDERDAAANRSALLKILSTVDPLQLQASAAQPGNPIVSGWVEYALMQRRYANPLQDDTTDADIPPEDLAAWQARFPGHPASQLGTGAYLGPQRGPINVNFPDARQIGVLLPMTSNFAAQAQAVYDGMVAMHNLDSRPQKPQLILYDTGAEADLASVYYNLALREGADFVVGPLGRRAVQSLVQQNSFTVPTLLLGHVPPTSGSLGNVFQFGLVPEDEAIQIANDAFADGHRVALSLYPQNSWGERLNTAFSERFQELGGEVVDSKAYGEEFANYPQVITSLLGINQSQQRHSRISEMIGVPPKFQPRRRQDTDFVFLASRPRSARLLKPQINFFQGHNLPVYATSHVFTGRTDRISDADLNGITFIDMPWILEQQGNVATQRDNVAQSAGNQEGNRLFAFGMDAYALVTGLKELGGTPGANYLGVSAQLSMGPGGRLQRRLPRARFVDGVPQTVEPAPALDSRNTTQQPANSLVPASPSS